MIDLDKEPKWIDVQENITELNFLVEGMSKRGTVKLQELGQLSFMFALLLEQTEQIITKERCKKQRNE